MEFLNETFKTEEKLNKYIMLRIIFSKSTGFEIIKFPLPKGNKHLYLSTCLHDLFV